MITARTVGTAQDSPAQTAGTQTMLDKPSALRRGFPDVAEALRAERDAGREDLI